MDFGHDEIGDIFRKRGVKKGENRRNRRKRGIFKGHLENFRKKKEGHFFAHFCECWDFGKFLHILRNWKNMRFFAFFHVSDFFLLGLENKKSGFDVFLSKKEKFFLISLSNGSPDQIFLSIFVFT